MGRARARLALGALALTLLGGLSACSKDAATSGTPTSNEKNGSAGDGSTGDDAVLERNKHASRDAHFIQPALGVDAVTKFALDETFQPTFTGAMWASPLYLPDGPQGRGVFFVVTTTNDVYALDEKDGSTVWTKHLAQAPTSNGLGDGCGNISPIGIESTPVIDAGTRTIYIAGAVGGDVIEKHQVYALSVDDGSARDGWPIDVSGVTSGDQTFDPAPENQRGALSLVGGTLYVPYGGHSGDCGPYHGWVVAIDTGNPNKYAAWATRGQGEGIWAAGGLASDGSSVFAVTGNSTVNAPDRTVSDSEQVMRLTGLAQFSRNTDDVFIPKVWQQMDSEDSDFGSSNPIYLTVPNSKPSNYVAAIAKDGHFYLVDSAHLGGLGGQLADIIVATSIHASPASYVSERGVHYVVSARNGGICPGGMPSGRVMVSILIAPGSPPTVSVDWCAKLNGPEVGVMATTTDDDDESIVWFVNDGKLTALDGDSGKQLFLSTETCDGVEQWTTPIAVKGRVIVGADGHLCSWSVR